MSNRNKITLKNLIQSIKLRLEKDSSSGCRIYEFPLQYSEDPYNSSKIFFLVTRLDNPKDSTKTNFAVRTLNENTLEFSEFKLVKGINNLITEAKSCYVFYQTNQNDS